jgi:ubiquinone/menaquinone biosynthesis C-methylase UbiE
MIRRLIEEAVFRVSMSAHDGRPKGDLSHRPATFSEDRYDEWRAESLKEQFESYFRWDLIRGKRVLDFGCGTGPLSLLCAENGAGSVIGIDLSAERVERARRISVNGHRNVKFILEEYTDRISLPDNSVDVIVCFDVMEHVMDYESIMREWTRVLAPGGCVLIWWSVWWHPYGHHLHTMIPLPWVHVFMSDESLFRVCARIYDTPQFQPRIWHFDTTGNRKPNPYRGRVLFDDLNKLTISRFDRAVVRAGLQARRKQVNPFSGSTLAGVKRFLATSPWPDFFCASAVYELEKP